MMYKSSFGQPWLGLQLELGRTCIRLWYRGRKYTSDRSVSRVDLKQSMEAADNVEELPYAMNLDLLRPTPPRKVKADASPLVNSRSVIPATKTSLIKRREKNHNMKTENVQGPVDIEVPAIALIKWKKPQIVLSKRYQEKLPERPGRVRHQHRVNSTWVKFDNKYKIVVSDLWKNCQKCPKKCQDFFSY